jgi:hypothetical protein
VVVQLAQALLWVVPFEPPVAVQVQLVAVSA